MSSFPLFPHLPPEIRLSIWLFAVPADVSEVCLPWPSAAPLSTERGAQPADFLPVLPLTVDTGFPAAMHACREARAVLRDTRRSGVRFRASRLAHCMVPFRVFRPDLDVLYLDLNSYLHLDYAYGYDIAPMAGRVSRALIAEAKRVVNGFVETLSSVKRLAVPIRLALLWDSVRLDVIVAAYFFEWGPLDQLIFVFPCSSAPDDDDDKDDDGDSNPASISVRRGGCRDLPLPQWFMPPGRRCRLMPVPALEDDQNILITTVRSSPRTYTAPEALAEARRRFAAALDENAIKSSEDLQITAGVFVEHQCDVTWREVCRERQYSDRDRLEVIPARRRANPEMVRVQDADLDPQFEPAYTSVGGFFYIYINIRFCCCENRPSRILMLTIACDF